MSDELRQAAERRRKALADSNDHDGGYPNTQAGHHQSFYDMATLADAYLAEHPADEDEPITDEFLEACGRKITGVNAFVMGGLVGQQYVASIERLHDLHWAYSDGGRSITYVPTPHTRAELRRLCKALGVELKESEA